MGTMTAHGDDLALAMGQRGVLASAASGAPAPPGRAPPPARDRTRDRSRSPTGASQPGGPFRPAGGAGWRSARAGAPDAADAGTPRCPIARARSSPVPADDLLSY